MIYIIAYDITDNKRRMCVAKTLESGDIGLFIIEGVVGV